ncbi:MAG: hypothetical protein WB918_01305, partial [Candidatus Sulfotelmatobacter sp.]
HNTHYTHFSVGRQLAVNLTQRNLFEVSVISFVICIASEVRALVPGGAICGLSKLASGRA